MGWMDYVGGRTTTQDVFLSRVAAAAAQMGTAETMRHNCVDPPAFYLTQTPSTTPTVTATATTTAAITTAATPAAAAASASGLTQAQKSGIIAGCILFTLAVVLAVLYYLHHRRKTMPAVLPAAQQSIVFKREEANGTVLTLQFPQNFVRQNPNMLNRALGGAGGEFRAAGIAAPGTAYGGRYMNDPDDDRVEDLGSDRY